MARIDVSRRSTSSRDPLRWAWSLPLLIAAWLAGAAPAVNAADVPGGSHDIAKGWQARAAGAAASESALSGFGSAWSSRSSFNLFGDYYFGTAAPGLASGGFRATGGLFVGPRSGLGLSSSGMSAMGTGTRTPTGLGLAPPSAPAASNDASSVPYVGVGYSGLKALRATGGGWAFSADVGVMALQPRSAVRLGQQPATDTLRDLQFSPLLQVGASYAF